MKLFIDTGSVAEVEEIAAWGVLSGATTNPSLLAKEDGDPGESIRRICELIDGPVSAEVVSDDARDDGCRGSRARRARRSGGCEGPVLGGGPRGHARALL